LRPTRRIFIRGEEHTSGRNPSLSPAERHREFERENGKWHERVEEVLSELDELAGERDERRSEEEDEEQRAGV
jgi:hypothetical protein